MSEQEMLNKIKELEEENKQLKKMIENKVISKNTTAYGIIANLITDKVDNEVHEDFEHCKQTIKRAIIEELKWELHVRYASDFQKENIEPARQFINNYTIDDFYKKPSELKEKAGI